MFTWINEVVFVYIDKWGVGCLKYYEYDDGSVHLCDVTIFFLRVKRNLLLDFKNSLGIQSRNLRIKSRSYLTLINDFSHEIFPVIAHRVVTPVDLKTHPII